MSAPQKVASLAQRRGVRQFVKFGIVGTSSTIINFLVLNVMLNLTNHRFISAAVAFLVSVVNGYVWNKRWTFREAQAKAVHTQFTQFLLVNLVGLCLDLLIIWLLSPPVEHHLLVSYPGFSADKAFKLATNIAQLVATAVIVFWNFFANRFWTFKH
ncbi:MAG: GtrA family protein [Armatimonadota bacterium]|nr:GtrA family protein [Armatimonadota bacterium]